MKFTPEHAKLIINEFALDNWVNYYTQEFTDEEKVHFSPTVEAVNALIEFSKLDDGEG